MLDSQNDRAHSNFRRCRRSIRRRVHATHVKRGTFLSVLNRRSLRQGRVSSLHIEETPRIWISDPGLSLRVDWNPFQAFPFNFGWSRSRLPFRSFRGSSTAPLVSELAATSWKRNDGGQAAQAKESGPAVHPDRLWMVGAPTDPISARESHGPTRFGPSNRRTCPGGSRSRHSLATHPQASERVGQ